MAIDLNIATTFLGDTDTPNTYVGQATKKVVVNALETGLEFVTDNGGSTNIMNTDLTATANRTQDMNSYSMYFNNAKQFKWINNVAPTIGEGSFDLQGSGTTSSDVLFWLKNGAGATKIKMNGVGNIGIGTNPYTPARIYLSETTLKGIYVEAQDEEAGYFYSSGNRGIFGISGTNYGGDFSSSSSYAIRMGGANGITYTMEGSNGRNAINIMDSTNTYGVLKLKNDSRIIMEVLKNSTTYANDVAAAAGGVEVGELYRNGSVVQIRLV